MFGLIRHGVTAYNKEGRAQGSLDIPLDEEGREMARKVAHRICGENWDCIYSSPLSRAKETAEIIAETTGLPLTADDRLRERGGGLTEGTTESERIERWGAGYKELDLQFESHEAVVERGMDFIQDMKTAYPSGRILVVSHGSFIKRVLKELMQDDSYDESLYNTSMTIVETTDEETHCGLHNCIRHLKRG